MILTIIIIWYLIGAVGTAYWIRRDDKTVNEKTKLGSYVPAVFGGFFGVFIWILGYLVIKEKEDNKRFL